MRPRLAAALLPCLLGGLGGLGGCSLYFGNGDDGSGSSPGTPAPVQDGGAAPVTDAAHGDFFTDQPGVYEMVVVGDYLYFANNGQFPNTAAHVSRIPIDGSAPAHTLFSSPDRIDSLAVTPGGEHVFATTAADPSTGTPGLIWQIEPGATGASIATSANPTVVRTDGTYVYFNDADSAHGTISRVPIGGGSATVVAADVQNPWDFTVAGGTLYYSEMNAGRIMRTPVTGTGSAAELAGGWVGTGWLTVDDTHVYFDACDTGACTQARLYRVPRASTATATTAATTLAIVGNESESKLALATSTTLLWGETLIPRTGGTVTPLAPQPGGYIAVAATDRYAFFADFYSGAIYRASL